MEKGREQKGDVEINFCVLRDKKGDFGQCWYSILPLQAETIAKQVLSIERAEKKLLKSLGVSTAAMVAKRFFSSDVISHEAEIRAYKDRCGTDFFMSLTEQPPANGVKLALLGMCLGYIAAKSRDDRIFSCETTAGVRHIFAEQLTDRSADESTDVETQTDRVFKILENELSKHHASTARNVLRTWLYAPHVDADYPGIVKARKRVFDSINLTKETHYIASTGIEGGSTSRFARVSMDAYAATGIAEEGVRYVQAPEFLGPTHVYGVTFERATAACLGKTDFLFISGTASIDTQGNIVHPGDVQRQAERTLENIEALLAAGKFALTDVSSLIVYLRDATDYGFVKPIISKVYADVPCVYVKAPVCRPGWLIEIEATAVRALE